MATHREVRQVKQLLVELGAVPGKWVNHGQIWHLPNGRTYMLSRTMTGPWTIRNALANVRRAAREPGR